MAGTAPQELTTRELMRIELGLFDELVTATPYGDPADDRAAEAYVAGMRLILTTGAAVLGIVGADWLSQLRAELAPPAWVGSRTPTLEDPDAGVAFVGGLGAFLDAIGAPAFPGEPERAPVAGSTHPGNLAALSCECGHGPEFHALHGCYMRLSDAARPGGSLTCECDRAGTSPIDRASNAGRAAWAISMDAAPSI